MKRILALLLALLVASPAWAGSSTVGITAGSGTNVAVTTDASSNVNWRNTLWDYSAAANGAAVDSGHSLQVAGEGTAGSAAGGVVSVQGVGSMTPFLVNPGTAANWGVGATGSSVPANAVYLGITSGGNLTGWTGAVTNAGTFAVQDSTTETNTGTIAGAVSSSVMQENVKQVNGVTVLTGTGATGTGAQRVTVSQDTNTIAGSAVGTAGSSSSNVVSVQGIASGTALPVSISGNQAVNLAQVGGNSVVTGGTNGSQGVGGLASTGSALAGNPVLVGGSDGTDVRNISTNSSGQQVIVGAGTAGSNSGGVLSVQGIASGTNLNVAQATASSLNATVVGSGSAGSAASGVVTVQGIGSMTPLLVTPSAAADPCMSAAKTNFALASSSGNTQVVAGSSGKKVYICSISLVAAATAVVNVIEGTGAACVTANEAAVVGSTTAANGMSIAANGGLTLGNGGGTVAVTATAANGICILQSGTTALAGNVTYVQQ